MKKKSLPLVIGGFVLFAALALLLLSYAGLLSFSANDHQYTAFGQSFVVNADWKNTNSKIGNQPAVSFIVGDSSGSSLIYVDVKVSGPDMSEDVRVEMPSLDLSKYKSVIIYRSVNIQITGDGRYNYVKSTLFDESAVSYGTQQSSGAYYQVNQDLGTIFVTNDGSVITVKSTEGNYNYDARKPLYFKNVVSVGNYGLNPVYSVWNYKVTGVEVIPFSAAEVPTEPEEDECFLGVFCGGDDEELPETSPPVEKESIFTRFWSWVKGLFS